MSANDGSRNDGSLWTLAAHRLAASRRNHTRPSDRALVDGKIDECRRDAERDRDPPDDVIAARLVVEPSAEPRAKEAADLVAEERHAREHREITDAEDGRDDAIGRRHRGEPQQAKRRREEIDGKGGDRQPEE